MSIVDVVVDDQYWIIEAEKAGKEGFLGTEKSKEFLEKLLNE